MKHCQVCFEQLNSTTDKLCNQCWKVYSLINEDIPYLLRLHAFILEYIAWKKQLKEDL